MGVNEPKRVLHIVSAMNRGGAETLLMNVYRNINRDQIQFDFVSHTTVKEDYEEEIHKLGGRIFKISSLGQQGAISYVKELRRLMSFYPFAAVHIHTDFQGGFPALAAKKSGIKKRICHSHSNNWPKGSSLSAKILLIALQALIRFSATNYSSCSLEAGQFLFGRKMMVKQKVKILKNGIDIESFKNTDSQFRQKLISEFHLPNQAKILGHVGRFSDSKNQQFILKVLKKLVEEDASFVALMVGDGPLRKEVEKETNRLGIRNQVYFLGVREDVSNLMKGFDVFLFPSKFEGFGIVALEAQCAGIPCVISDTVPRSTDMGLELASYIPLEELDSWCSQVKKSLLISRPEPEIIAEQISKSGYSIQTTIGDWLQLYGAS